jgi:sugar phosphate isomerase/epimerase
MAKKTESTAAAANNFPKLHNAMWPGLVGKGSPGAEPCIELDTMLDMTAKAEVNGVKFDGVDIFLFDPHVNIDSSDDDLKRLADKVRRKNLVIGSVVAPIWPPTGGGSAMGGEEDRAKFVEQVRKGCRIAKKLRELGVRPYGVVRIDSASGVGDWEKDPRGNTKKIAKTFKEAGKVARDHGERLAAEGEICWGGMHSWKAMLDLLEEVGQPKLVGFQADMAHTLLYLLGFVLDFIEITFVVVPIVGPVLLAMGLDPVWLGIMIAINLQTSFLTPPFGFALFYLRGVAPAGVSTGQIYRGVMPFVALQLFSLLIIALWPELATWLPEKLYGR